MHELRFADRGLGRVRFAISPLWETTNALRVLRDPEPRAYHLPWLESVRSRLDEIDAALFFAVQPLRGFTPDFLAPVPCHGDVRVADQLADVATTPLEVVSSELHRAIHERGGEEVPGELRDLASRPMDARARYADALATAWDLLVKPHWPRLRALLNGDISHHSSVLARGGVERVVPSLSPQLRWSGRGVLIRSRSESWGAKPKMVTPLDHRGLVLIPSAFSWPSAQVISDAPWQPAVVYPARRIAELWQPVPETIPDALGLLLGRTRALLLVSLREPASTLTLAHRHGLASATVNEHLSVLHRNGLLAAERLGRTVIYAVTPLGETMVRGSRGDL